MNYFEKSALVEEALRDARGSGSWVRVNCPFCPELLGKVDRARALSVSSTTGWWGCWRCGTKGRREGFEGVERPEPPPPEPGTLGPPKGFFPLFDEDGARSLVLAAPRDYLAGRGVTPQRGAQARLGAVLSGRLSGRVVVPVFGEDDRTWVGYVARTWVGSKPTYLNAVGMRRETLYNHRALTRVTDDPVIVVEGCFDALALWPDAVAVLGKPTETQIDALAACPRPVVVVLDGDAWKESWGLCQQLRLRGHRAGWVKLPPGKDPDEMPRDALFLAARASLGER